MTIDFTKLNEEPGDFNAHLKGFYDYGNTFGCVADATLYAAAGSEEVSERLDQALDNLKEKNK